MVKRMRGNFPVILSILAAFGALFMLNYTSPLEAGALGVLVFFIMIFIFLYGVMYEVIKIIQRILGAGGKQKGGVEKRTYMYATVAAFGPIMLLIIRTFSAVNVFTIMLTAIFVFLSCFLIYKRA
ncbi:hypothetical protein IJI72_01425 [Candidatus Saccharibacteria bacterium]|nr:hypothetical protein [Candidatus Saccharibacteria bacterium]